MNTCPREPSIGDKISASWMRELVRYVRSITPMPGRNVRLRRTPNGTFIDGTPGGKGGGAATKADRGTWRIETIQIDNPEGGTPEKVDRHVFRHCHYMKGCVPESFDPEEGVPEGEHEIYIEDEVANLEEGGSVIFAFRFRPDGIYNDSDPNDKAKILTKPDMDGIRELARDVSWCVLPLYEIGKDVEVIVDFRGMPVAPLIEEGVGV